MRGEGKGEEGWGRKGREGEGMGRGREEPLGNNILRRQNLR
jgi:hypothetical protein